MIIQQSEARNVSNLNKNMQSIACKAFLENRQVRKWRKFKERSRKEKFDGVVQDR